MSMGYLIPAPLDKTRHTPESLLHWTDEELAGLAERTNAAIRDNNNLYRRKEQERETAIAAFRKVSPHARSLPAALRRKTPPPPDLSAAHRLFLKKVHVARIRKQEADEAAARRTQTNENISAGLKDYHERRRQTKRMAANVGPGQQVIEAAE